MICPNPMGGSPMPVHRPIRGVCRLIAFAATVLLLGVTCAVAQTKGPPPPLGPDGCGGRRAGTPDERIAACSEIIDSRRASAADRAAAFSFRAIAFRQKSD